jgi:hypothetical protein
MIMICAWPIQLFYISLFLYQCPLMHSQSGRGLSFLGTVLLARTIILSYFPYKRTARGGANAAVAGNQMRKYAEIFRGC